MLPDLLGLRRSKTVLELIEDQIRELRGDEMEHKGCKHLDYESEYLGCKLKTLDEQGFPGVKYWDRLEGGFVSPKELKEYPDTPIKVQFCKLRGRINGIFQCINPGELPCYEEDEECSHDGEPINGRCPWCREHFRGD